MKRYKIYVKTTKIFA